MPGDFNRYEALYYEEVPFSAGRIAAFIMAAIALVMLGFWVFQASGSPIGDEELPSLFYLGMGLFFTVLAALLFHMSNIVIVITEDMITASVGFFNFSTSLSNISEVLTDEHSSLKYGGWGIRMRLYKEGWALAYTTFKYKRVVLALKEGKYKRFIFSSANPQQITDILNGLVKSGG